MSLDKAIEHGKEHRKPYRGGKAIDPECRNHGGCPACESNRKHKYEKAMPVEETDCCAGCICDGCNLCNREDNPCRDCDNGDMYSRRCIKKNMEE